MTTTDPNNLTAVGALIVFGATVFRIIWKRMERMEQRAEKRLDLLEAEVGTLRNSQSATAEKYNWLKGWTENARNCAIAGCPNRSNLTPPMGTRAEARIGSEPGQPSTPKITPLLPR